jgi:exonuclease SbcC
VKALSEAKQTAERAQQARNHLRTAEESRAETEKKLAGARKPLSKGRSQIEELEKRIASVEKALSESKYDPDLHMRLREALRLVQDIEKEDNRVKELRAQLNEQQERLNTLRQSAVEAAAQLEQAIKESRDAEAALEELRRADAAAALRRRLKAGDPCPVCGRALGELPPEKHVELDEGENAVRRASERLDTARQVATEAQEEVKLTEQRVATLQDQIHAVDENLSGKRTEMRELIDGPASAAEIAARVRELEAAKSERQRLEKEVTSLREERERRSRDIADADKDVALLDSKLKTLNDDIDRLNRQIEEDLAALRSAAQKSGWTDILHALDSGRDPAPIVAHSLSKAQDDLNTTQREIGSAETQLSQIEVAIERAQQLREDEKRAREEASLARDLAMLLRADRFQAFVREQALRVLAEDGSECLREISRGRYDFSVQGQDFLVVDRWNGGEERSVKTLSGGETFLASLALALALAQRLPELGAGSQTRSLESLFIDEGFSHLDEDTLQVVADALEALRAGQDRMVGIVTHVSALAERMPHRIIVHKQPSGSTITVG